MKRVIAKIMGLAMAMGVCAIALSTNVKASEQVMIHGNDACPCGGTIILVEETIEDVLCITFRCTVHDYENGCLTSTEAIINFHPYTEPECTICHPERFCGRHRLVWYANSCEPDYHHYGCMSCFDGDESKTHLKGKGGADCTLCNDPHKKVAVKEEAVVVVAEEKHEDLSAKAFGGRKAEQLSVAEQKTAVSYALDSLRASGNALAANVVTTNNGGNGKAADIAAVVADNRDSANQQMFAQAACANLGFKNVTPLKTYNMYSLHSTYTSKNGSQVITWANTGLKAGDTAFVVWYNQKLGKIELLPALVDAKGSVLVSVPALGDVSTMTVVKAAK